MRHFSIFLMAVLLILIGAVFFVGQKTCAASWSFTVIDSKTPSPHGRSPSLALDSNNKLHISYFDYTNTNKNIRYATNTSGTWKITTLDNEVNVGQDTSLALDSNNKVHISYYDEDDGNLKYATNASGVWVYTIVDNGFEAASKYNVGEYNSLALDSNNKVHISYYNASKRSLKYATNLSGTWVSTTVDSGALDSEGNINRVGGYNSLALDPDNKVYISYSDSRGYYSYDKKTLRRDLKYATNVSGTWEITTLDNEGDGSVGMYTSLALDSNNKVHISYYDEDNINLKYATNASGTWVYIVVDEGKISSLAVDSNNKVHISYNNSDGLIKYATNIFGAWKSAFVDVGDDNFLALNSNNKAYIVYDCSRGNGTLKYARLLSMESITTKFVFKSLTRAVETLIKKGQIYSVEDFDFVFPKLPSKLKEKNEYDDKWNYLSIQKSDKYSSQYANVKKSILKKYWQIETNLYAYEPKTKKQQFKVKFTFKYSQKEFKNLKKQNKSIKEKDIVLKYYDTTKKKWKTIDAKHNIKKNTLTATFTKFSLPIMKFAIGKE